MPRTVACVIVDTPRVFEFLGHMPLMTWSTVKLADVRGVDRVVCVTTRKLAAQAGRYAAGEDGLEVVPMPDAVAKAEKTEVLDAWLTSAGGPACDADIVIALRPTAPFLPAAKIEACVRAVARGKHKRCMPVRMTRAVAGRTFAKVKVPVDSVRVFAVGVPVEAEIGTVPVSPIEALDATNDDDFVFVDAMVAADKV